MTTEALYPCVCGIADKMCNCVAPVIEKLRAKAEAHRQEEKRRRERKREEKQQERVHTHSPEVIYYDPETEAEARKAENAAKFDCENPPARPPAVDGGPVMDDADFWRDSLANMAGECISLMAYWDQKWPCWESYEASSDLQTLARQAGDTWNNIAKKLRTK